jgi:lipopolysaccharide export system permease protein
MKIIDWYILKKYLTTFVFCLLLFTVIVVVVDVSEKTDDFVKSGLPVWRIFTDYYMGFIPRITALLFPLFVFISVIFFTSKMASRSEVVAILSSGVSFRRYLVPFMFGALLLGSLLWLGYRYVVPPANRLWGQFEAKYIDVNFAGNTNKNYLHNYYWRIDSNTYAGIRFYDTAAKSGNNFMIQRFSKNQMVYNLRADGIRWDTATRRWRLENATERWPKGVAEDVKRWPVLQMNYNFKPRDLRRDDYLKDQLPTPELDEFIAQERMRGSEMLNTLLVERYNRDSIPVSVLILTFIGAVLASRRVRGGSGFHLALGVVISVLYILFSRFSLVFATKGNFTPVLAAWLPNILFGLLALYFYKRAPK